MALIFANELALHACTLSCWLEPYMAWILFFFGIAWTVELVHSRAPDIDADYSVAAVVGRVLVVSYLATIATVTVAIAAYVAEATGDTGARITFWQFASVPMAFILSVMYYFTPLFTPIRRWFHQIGSKKPNLG